MKKIAVFWESLGRKELVGTLERSGKLWTFLYSPQWITTGVQIDPDLPLQKRPIRSPTLHAFFFDRIPPRDSGHFGHYAKAWKLGSELSDPLALLATLGHRGPSNYVFYPVGFTPGRWTEELPLSPAEAKERRLTMASLLGTDFYEHQTSSRQTRRK